MSFLFLNSLSYFPDALNDFNEFDRPISTLLTSCRCFAAALTPHLLMKPEICTRRNTELLMKTDTKIFTIRLNLTNLDPCPPQLLGPLIRNCSRLLKLEMTSDSSSSVSDEHLLLISNQLPSLESLSLPNCRDVTDDGIECLKKFQYLREFSYGRLSKEHVSEDMLVSVLGHPRLKRTLRKLCVLSVGGCSILSNKCLAGLLLKEKDVNGYDMDLDRFINYQSTSRSSSPVLISNDDYFRESKLEHLSIAGCRKLFRDTTSINILAFVMMNSLTYFDASETAISEVHFKEVVERTKISSSSSASSQPAFPRASPLRTLRLDMTEVKSTAPWIDECFPFLNELALSRPLQDRLSRLRALPAAIQTALQARLVALNVTPGNNNHQEEQDRRLDLQGVANLDLLNSLECWGDSCDDTAFASLSDAVCSQRCRDEERQAVENTANNSHHHQRASRNNNQYTMETSLRSLICNSATSSEATDDSFVSLSKLNLSSLETLSLSVAGQNRFTSKGFCHFVMSLRSMTNNSSNPTGCNLKTLNVRTAVSSRRNNSASLINDDCFKLITMCLVNLENLNIASASITAESFVHIKRLEKTLKSLVIDVCQDLTDDCMAVFKKQQDDVNSFPNLTTLCANGNGWLTDEGLAHFSCLPFLDKLEFEDCIGPTDDGFECLAKGCRRLRSLACSRNMMFTDKSLTVLHRSVDIDRDRDESTKSFPSLLNVDMRNCFAFSTSLKAVVIQDLAKKGIHVSL